MTAYLLVILVLLTDGTYRASRPYTFSTFFVCEQARVAHEAKRLKSPRVVRVQGHCLPVRKEAESPRSLPIRTKKAET